MSEKNFTAGGRTTLSTGSANKDQAARGRIVEQLRAVTGMSETASGDEITAEWERQLDARAAKAGLPAGSTVPAIRAAEQANKQRQSDMRLFATTVAGAATDVRVGGVKLLSKEEGQEAASFGALTHHARKRVEATELHFGKDLRECLIDGDLK